MTKKTTMLDLFDAFIEKNHSTEEKVIIAVESYVTAYDLFDNVEIIINPTDEVIEQNFLDIDNYLYAVYENGKRVDSN